MTEGGGVREEHPVETGADLLDLEEAARYLDVSRDEVVRLVEERRLRPRAPGPRFTRRSIEWLRRTRTSAGSASDDRSAATREEAGGVGAHDYAEALRREGRLEGLLEAREEEVAALRRRNRLLEERLARQEVRLGELAADVERWRRERGVDLDTARAEAERARREIARLRAVLADPHGDEPSG